MSNPLGPFIAAVYRTGGSFNALFDLMEKSCEILSKNLTILDNVMKEFAIEKFTCLHAGILCIKCASQVLVDKDILLDQIVSFFEKCDVEHARMIPQYLRPLSTEFVTRLITIDQPIRGIIPLLSVIQRLQLTPSHLTVFHYGLCQIALSAKVFKPILPILDANILDLDCGNSSADGKDCLLYFYYAGMIYCALKMWSHGLHMFELCLTLPSVSLSCILVEAAKKAILVSLNLHGKFSTSLDVRASHFSYPKHWKRYCSVYLSLAQAFQNPNPDLLRMVVERHRSVFVSDHNEGLVKQVVKSHAKFRIHSLTKTFMTMSLSDVANRVKLASAEDAEKYLVEMIESKAIFAYIDQGDGTVHFQDDPEQYNSVEMLVEIQKKMDECMNLEKQLMLVSDNLLKNPHYAKKVLESEAVSVKSSKQN